VLFDQPNCKKGPEWSECAHLTLETWGRDSRGQPDVDQGMRDFLRQLRQHRGVRREHDPSVTRFASFDASDSGTLTIWQVRSSFWHDYFLTMITQRDVLVTMYLEARDIKDIEPKLDSLKELARSVRITDASMVFPDIVKIDAKRLSDAAIKQQLLQITPPGTPMERVHQILEWRLVIRKSPEVGLSGELQWVNGDLYTQIDSYPNPGPFATVVEVFWKADKQHKLRDIEIRRRAIEYKSKRAIPLRH
jgi:hypothetical protein